MDQLYPFRFVFDTVYVVFMELLFQNLVSGMMIDTFSGLKEADAERDEDKRSTCYICSLTKSEVSLPLCRWRSRAPPSRSTRRSICSGTISSISTV